MIYDKKNLKNKTKTSVTKKKKKTLNIWYMRKINECSKSIDLIVLLETFYFKRKC